MHFFDDVILRYPQSDRDDWKRAEGAAKRALIPGCCHLDPSGIRMLERQPAYHFGEMTTARHFNQLEGWLAFRFYVLAYEPDLKNPRFAAGGAQVRRLFPKSKLAALVAARGPGRSDKGEPDLFLYKPNGEAMFLEVKVDTDKLHPSGSQLQCLAQIRDILGCRAEVVHLVPEEKAPKARRYWVEPAPAGTVPLQHGETIRSSDGP